MQFWKIQSEEENLLKNQILSEKNMFKKEQKNVLRQLIFSIIKNIADPELQNWLEMIDTEAKSKDWFVPKLSRRESEEYLAKEPVGTFVVRMGRRKEYLALTLMSDDCAYDHYKIVQSQGAWTVQGCQKSFSSLSSLVIHLSIMKEVLPFTLRRDW